MTDVTLEFIAKRLEIIQAEQREARAELTEVRLGLTVLTEMTLKVMRDMVQVKEMLGRMESRLSKFESVAP